MVQTTVLVVGHMVRFLPKAERLDDSGDFTRSYPPKVGAFILAVGDDLNHFHLLPSRAHENSILSKDEDPGTEVTAPIMTALQKAYPFGSKIEVDVSTNRTTGKTKYFLFEQEKVTPQARKKSK